MEGKEGRFAPPLTNVEFQAALQQRTPKNTQNSTQWAVETFKKWSVERSVRPETREDPNFPIASLEQSSVESLNYWISKFIFEARTKTGEPYSPGTLTSLVAGLQRYIREDLQRPGFPKILEKACPEFKTVRDTLDARRKHLLSIGIGTHPRQADPILQDEEKLLWDSGVFNTSNALGLSYVMYFYNNKLFGFRARDEHAELKTDQYVFGVDPRNRRQYVEYHGRLAKNVTGSYMAKATPRRVMQYANPENPRCLVQLFRRYIGLVQNVGTSGRFYLRPLPNKEGRIVFSEQPVGINTLAKYHEKMFEKAGIQVESRNITGHSGKVTLATSLYEKGFDEQAIKSRTGHSSDAVRSYKRPSLGM
jgi:hypothetical protein